MMMKLRGWMGMLSCVGLIASGCADGGAGGNLRADAGRLDAGASTPDTGVTADTGVSMTVDAGVSDAGAGASPDAALDAGPGEAGACEACETHADCQEAHYCAALESGGNACLPSCNPDLPECPPRFECVMNFTDDLPFPVCAPIGERCCVDPDGDLHGTGVGCLGIDCNEDQMTINASASEICNGEDDDCDMMTDEGDANVLCPRGPHVATTACESGMCELVACEMSYENCNMDNVDGCETYLRSLSDCAGCGLVCARSNASESCESGTCQLTSCNGGWGDCDGVDPNGCETDLTSIENCGGCGNRCDYPNASAVCSGSCAIGSCDSGFNNCDGNTTNGCEVQHSSVVSACGGGMNAGTFDGDRSCGTGFLGTCEGNTSWDLFATYTGTSSAWFRARVREDSGCSADIEHRIRLAVPSGVNYDLYVYKGSCGTTPSASTGDVGADETVTVRGGDSFGSDDDFNYYVEVRYVSGASCTPWTLRFDGHDC